MNWIRHDAIRYWKKEQHVPLKIWLHGIREARNGELAHLFDKDVATRQTVANIVRRARDVFLPGNEECPELHEGSSRTRRNLEHGVQRLEAKTESVA
jgi:hypothetical protein